MYTFIEYYYIIIIKKNGFDFDSYNTFCHFLFTFSGDYKGNVDNLMSVPSLKQTNKKR